MYREGEEEGNLKILFVCLGNICRSPLAEGLFKELLRREGLSERVEVGSAGTSDYHVGEPPHPGVRRLARRHGFSLALDGKRARQLSPQDVRTFDLIVAMDRSNLEEIVAMSPEARAKTRLLLDFAKAREKDVHDPYYTGDFERTYRQVEAGCRGLLEHLRGRLALERRSHRDDATPRSS